MTVEEAGSEGGGISRFCVVDCFKCRGKEEDDHHSRNLRRNIEVGRMRFRDEDRKGRMRVLRNVIGDRERDVLPAISFVGGGGVYISAYPFQQERTSSPGVSRVIFKPINRNNGL